MKGMKRISVWIIISLLVQIAGLFYLDRFFFVSGDHFKPKKFQKEEKKVAKVDVKVPEGAKNISTSFDGRYIAYYEGEVLKTVDTKTATVKNVQLGSVDKEAEGEMKLSNYKWISGIDRMIVAVKKGNGLYFYSYDVQKSISAEIKDEINNKVAYIQLPDKKSEVEDIQASTLTNMIYVKIAHSGKRNSIYSINVMAQMQKINTGSYLIGDIGLFPHEDKLAYEDLTYKKVRITGVQNSFTIKGASSTLLIGVDSEDLVYLGQQENEQVRKIVYGSIKDPLEKWKTIELKVPANKKNIYVSQEGKIFVNDDLKGEVLDISNEKQIPYKGTFFQMYSDGIASILDGKLVKTELK